MTADSTAKEFDDGRVPSRLRPVSLRRGNAPARKLPERLTIYGSKHSGGRSRRGARVPSRSPLVGSQHYPPHYLKFIRVSRAVDQQGFAERVWLTPALRYHMLKLVRRKSDVQAPIMWWVQVSKFRIALKGGCGASGVRQM